MRRNILRNLVLVALLGGALPRPAIAQDAGEEDASLSCDCDRLPAECDAACGCDAECEIDWSADPCADVGGCADEPDLDDAALEAEELADGDADADDAALSEPTALLTAACAAVTCADGSACRDGRCVDEPTGAPAPALPSGGGDLAGGCATTRAPRGPSAAGTALLLLLAAAGVGSRRRRRAAPLLVLPLCVASLSGCGPTPIDGWDPALEQGPPVDAAGQFLDVQAAERADGRGARLLLANQPLEAGHLTPSALFSLSRRRLPGALALRRAPAATGCGDRLVADPSPAAGELLGWAAPEPLAATATLQELVAPDGCGVLYEVDAEAITADLQAGYTLGAALGQVWPPGWGDAPAPADDAEEAGGDEELLAARSGGALSTAAPCDLGPNPALVLFYTVLGSQTDRFLRRCPGEVVVGSKHERRPPKLLLDPTARAAGLRGAFVLGDHGNKIRRLLREQGVARTAAYLQHKLDVGYDYLVIDEVTADPEWADGATVSRRFRQLLLRLPRRSVIAYISLDLTMRAGGGDRMRGRRLLLRALKRRGRALALEVYLHTGEVAAGAAPAAFRRAADRVASAVRGLRGAGGIARHEITALGLSMHTAYPQYNYLDRPSGDLRAITRQVTALRHGSGGLRRQHGIGYYFVGLSDITPRSNAYSLDDLIRRLRAQARRFGG